MHDGRTLQRGPVPGRHRAARRLGWLVSAVLAGCAPWQPVPTPTAAPAVAPPPRWADAGAQLNPAAPGAAGGTAVQAAAPVTPLAAWWQRFDDPLLVALVDEAMQANASLRSASAALAQSRAVLQVQTAALQPSLSGSLSAQRARSGNNGTANQFQAALDAAWEPDVWGGQHAAVRAAQADVAASAYGLGDAQVSVAAEVAGHLLQWRGLLARLAIAEANLASQQATLQITEWRAQAGLLTALDVAQARSAALQTRALLPALRSSAGQTAQALAVLTGRPPAALQDRLASAALARAEPAQAWPAPAGDLVLAFPADTLRQRADVRVAQARLEAALQRVAVADAARWPSLRLSGSLGLSALTLGGLGHGGAVLAALLASLQVPIADGGAARAQWQAQQAAALQAAAAYDAAVLLALREVEDSLLALRGHRDQLASQQAAADSAGQAARLAGQRYRSGLVDFQVVLDTQRSLLATQDAVASTATALGTDHVALYKALGGGWQPQAAPLALGPR